jgi:hypothetical protein
MAFMQIRRKKRRTPMLATIAGVMVGSAVAYWLRSIRKNANQSHGPERGRVALHRSPLIEELSPEPEELDDDLLLELVRSELGRSCSYPGAIDISCDRGVVRLEGPVLKSELNRVLRSVARIPGVEEIRDHLSAHRHPWGVTGQTPAGMEIEQSIESAP